MGEETQAAVAQAEYDRYSIPKVQSIARKASETLGRIRPRWGAGRFTAVIDKIKKGFDEDDRVTSEAAENIELFRPFIFENQDIVRADNSRALRDRMPPDDQARLVWGPENLDLYDYWMNVHFPGLERWVLPELDETYAARPKQVYSYHDLLELFDSTAKLHATRPALRIERGGRAPAREGGQAPGRCAAGTRRGVSRAESDRAQEVFCQTAAILTCASQIARYSVREPSWIDGSWHRRRTVSASQASGPNRTTTNHA